jgi:voltage-gated potassium channel Kch
MSPEQIYRMLSEAHDRMQSATDGYEYTSEEYHAIGLAMETIALSMKALDRVRARVKVSEILMGAAQ